MDRPALAVALLAGLAFTTPAWSAPPDAAKVRVAGEEFDAGARAFKDKDFEVAASHFESADAAVPSAKVLRLAMRARAEAGQGSRAATLAALAVARYADDAETVALAKEIIAKNEAALHKIEVSCASPCILAVGTRAIHGEATTRWVLYVDPGKTTVSASFFGDAGSASRSVDAKAAGSIKVRFEPEGATAAPVAPAPSPSTSAPKPAPRDEPAADPAKDEGPIAIDTSGSSGLPPAVFMGGIIVTAALGGVTIWSGLDTKNNPGVDAVRAACAGQTTDCPAYQDGVSRQNRTNILIGATAGAGAITILLGAVFTDWGNGEPQGTGRVTPLVAIGDGSAALLASGRF